MAMIAKLNINEYLICDSDINWASAYAINNKLTDIRKKVKIAMPKYASIASKIRYDKNGIVNILYGCRIKL